MTHNMVLLFLAVTGLACAQPAARPAFDAASVKPYVRPEGGGWMRVGFQGGPGTSDPGRISYAAVTLKAMLARAYALKEFQIEGPSWLETERYDVIASIPRGTTPEQFQWMLQDLLTDRFHLAMRRENRALNVYALTVGKNGLKLKEAPAAPVPGPGTTAPPPPPPPPPPTPVSFVRIGQAAPLGHLKTSLSLQQLAGILTYSVDRPVVDLTATEGVYAFDLNWVREDVERPEGAEPGLTLVQALDQYGIRMEPRKHPTEILVIEQGNKVPTEN